LRKGGERKAKDKSGENRLRGPGFSSPHDLEVGGGEKDIYTLEKGTRRSSRTKISSGKKAAVGKAKKGEREPQQMKRRGETA